MFESGKMVICKKSFDTIIPREGLELCKQNMNKKEAVAK